MTFAHWWVLTLLVLPLLVGAWHARRAGRAVTVPVDHGQAPRRESLRRWVTAAEVVPLALVAVAIVTFAEPQRAVNGPVERDLRNIHILLDSSNSMCAPFGQSTRHDAAMDAIDRFAGRQKRDAFALTLFGGSVLNWIPLTQDLTPLRLARPFLNPRRLPEAMVSGTSTGLALTTVAGQLRHAPAGDRMVILLTDGIAGDLDDKAIADVIAKLIDARVKVYTVLTNSEAVPPDAGEISTATGGALFHAEDPDALGAVFDQIDQMSATRMRPTSASREDWFFPVLAVGLPLLALHVLLLLGVRFTPW